MQAPREIIRRYNRKSIYWVLIFKLWKETTFKKETIKYMGLKGKLKLDLMKKCLKETKNERVKEEIALLN